MDPVDVILKYWWVVVVPAALFVLLLRLGKKTCPKCKERVVRDASVCKACGSAL